MTFELPKLTYSFDALEPFIDAQTMEVHYSKHHQTYLDNFKKVLDKYPNLQDQTAEDLLKNLNSLKVEETDRKQIRNHGGGFVNHNIYWSIMGPEKKIDQELLKDIEKTFGSLDIFKEQFNKAALGLFGSGWAWLVRDEENNLEICALPNQDSPLTMGHTPILGLDVWEHAYYLKYQNKRADYINAWWNVVKII
ncbi:MAG: superoxide dismutase [Candidatus Magasanikbacteria bacterium]